MCAIAFGVGKDNMRPESRLSPLRLACLCSGLLLFALLVFAWPTLADPSVLELSASVAPDTVQVSQRLTYTLTIFNSGGVAALNAGLAQTLPVGFTHIPGSTRITSDRTLISTRDPAITGRALRWSNLTVPAARSAGVYGVHTFVQDRCDSWYIGFQLDRARELMGANAYVKQLCYGITVDTPGPRGCWVEFVNACYDRELIPILRLEGPYGGSSWTKPPASAPGDYTEIAQAFARVVAGLPRRGGRPLYIEIWNEPNLDLEWSGQTNPVEYANFLIDVAAALRALGDARIVILNGALAPGGNYNNLAFIEAMATVPGAMQAFDIWASHPYPANHPPEYNSHGDTMPLYRDMTIDSYLLELERLAAHGRSGLRVLLTETGYALGSNTYGFEGYPPIGEGNRADYISRALRDYWSRWPEVLGVCPFELVDPYNNWWVWDWLYPDGSKHWQYDVVAALDKTPPLAKGELRLSFQARAGGSPGTYGSSIQVASDNAGSASLANAAPVRVLPAPATATLTRTRTPTSTPSQSPTPSPTPICFSVACNGGFEADESWEIPDTAYPAAYSSALAHSGTHSMRLGIVGGAPILSYSSARQAFYIPPSSTSTRITFWYYPLSEDTTHGRQYALLLDANKQYLETIMWLASDGARWNVREYEVVGHTGETLWVQFGVYNDGQGGVTAMYVDDVTVQVCGPEGFITPTPTAGATPSATPISEPSLTATPSPSLAASSSPTPEPSPSATTTPTETAIPTTLPPTATTTSTPPSHELLINGGFEEDGGWVISRTAYPAALTGVIRHSGARAMRLGIEHAADNVLSYSSAGQSLDLPNAPNLTLTFWFYPLAGDATGDAQYLLLLDKLGNYTRLMWITSDARSWLYQSIDLSAYAGQQVTLRFGVYNDGQGGVAAMYLDDVSLIQGATAPNRSWLPVILKGSTSKVSQEMETPRRPLGLAPLAVPGELARSARIQALALDAERRRLILASEDALLVLDAPSGRLLFEHQLPAPATALAVESSSGRVYAALPDIGELHGLSPDGKPHGRVEGLGRPTGLAVGLGRIYVADGVGRRLVMLDSASYGILATRTLPAAPHALALDPLRRRLYVGQMGSGVVLALDADHLRLLGEVALGGLGYPLDLALDVKANKLYIVHALSPKYGAISLVDAARMISLFTLWGSQERPLFGADTVRVDAQRGLVYLGQSDGILTLDAKDLATRGHLRVSRLGLPGTLAVDPLDGTAYIAGDRARLWSWQPVDKFCCTK